MTLTPALAAILAVFTALSFACGGDDEPPLTDATSLECPAPGDLPFRLESRGFQVSANRDAAKANPRIKDEASDILGNPGGVLANVYLPDDQAPATGPVAYAGLKARTMPTQGLFAKPLPQENVSLWTYDDAAASWTMVDRGVTDADGLYSLTGSGFVADAGVPVYSMLEADGSCGAHYTYLYPPGTKFVVIDIDGTLTINDEELFIQISEPDHTPVMMTAGNTLAQAWADKGYLIVYMTARAHVFNSETRIWLDELGFPKGPIITQNGGAAHDVYKTLWLQRMISTFGWVPYAAYGNASTDIHAYANVSIPLDRTFIIGPNAGMGGTVAIPNMDYTQHIADFVVAQPPAN